MTTFINYSFSVSTLASAYDSSASDDTSAPGTDSQDVMPTNATDTMHAPKCANWIAPGSTHEWCCQPVSHIKDVSATAANQGKPTLPRLTFTPTTTIHNINTTTKIAVQTRHVGSQENCFMPVYPNRRDQIDLESHSTSDAFLSMASTHSSGAFQAQDDDPALPSSQYQQYPHSQEASMLYLLSGAPTPVMCTDVVDDDDECSSYDGTDTSLGKLNPSLFEMDGATLRSASPTSETDHAWSANGGKIFDRGIDASSHLATLELGNEKESTPKAWCDNFLARTRGNVTARTPDRPTFFERFQAAFKLSFGRRRIGASQ
ncbi:hypothetical protein BCR44DRAFT_1513752 [Catenaria anguillulae PL171]|uniref:Uncharacterized protein n=1 Tax=Catenaria anguillulae PL171 TaxID=765915 RepID=A0A1Y2HLJ4_9FUNG|nr:hypothetical protein BCR44DRAFT_1513752 [Catenaria anguillulae PL171]